MAFELAVAVDVVSALAMLVVGGAFYRLWRSSRASLHLLLAFAFTTLASGIATVSTSEFDLSGASAAVDGFRVVTHTAAPLMLVIGYVAARRGTSVSAGAAALVAIACSSGLAVLFYVAPPGGAIAVGSVPRALAAAHTLQFFLYLSLVLLSARSLFRQPSLRRALVPLAFLAYAFSKYTWLLIDLSGDRTLVPFVYLWRFLMLGLMLAALLGPFLRGGADAEA